MRMVKTRSMLGLAAVATFMAACGNDNDGSGNDSLLTGFSAFVIIAIIVVVVFMRRRR